jgi:hypothetical protein
MKLVLVLFSFFALNYAFSQASEIEIVVASELVDCNKDVKQKCFQAKKTTDPYWTFQILKIEDFEYEEGYEYHLKITVSAAKDNEPVYQLVSIINQKKIN